MSAVGRYCRKSPVSSVNKNLSPRWRVRGAFKSPSGRSTARVPRRWRFAPSQISFRQQHMNALVAIDKLRHTKITGERAKHIGLIARQVRTVANVLDHLTHSLLGRVVQILVKADRHQVGGAFR